MEFVIRNNRGEEIKYQSDEFDGFDAYEMARDTWDDWLHYEVLRDNQILETVFNPITLEVVPHSLH